MLAMILSFLMAATAALLQVILKTDLYRKRKKMEKQRKQSTWTTTVLVISTFAVIICHPKELGRSILKHHLGHIISA